MTLSHHVAQRVRQLREQRGLSQSDLSRRLIQLGGRLDRSQVARCESRERGISIDELALFALALDTSVVALLFPEGDARVELTPANGVVGVETSAREARLWASGQAPLHPYQDGDAYRASHA